MVEIDVTIINRLGLHARACAKLVKAAAHYESRVELLQGDESADAKSIMSLMMLAAPQGSQLTLKAEGADAQAAAAEIMQLINERFGEEE
ncbi:MAG: HPr family phosphocarrier protein [Proteobacteria bacterium]|nr:HPr family phosphocarrier protein [Pseudomonadota bacterium]MBT5227420.1 HPr family phosphocarrier protein [Pseudomonadota bacterium]MBT5819489.1 HPr family phosphocarrier protein [Pseudomonadota bacterium]MBT6347737.1 HPr family phosphocarrier protein [Pseudomonadota bacterium]